MIRTIISHAASTWAIAHALHAPLMLMVFAFFSVSNEMFGIFGLIIIMALVASLPAIVVFWGVLHLIINASLSPKTKLFIWVIVAPFLVAINAFLFAVVLTEGDFDHETRELAIFFGSPSVIVTLIAVLIRSQQFLALNEHVTSQKINEDDNNDLKNQIV